MGRYYRGDIEGKFWFGIQSSTDASFFGGDAVEPQFITYLFTSDDLIDIQKGIERCNDKLGDDTSKLDAFFKTNSSYDDAELSKKTGIPPKKLNEKLQWYARLALGEAIHQCVKEKGSCQFEAEL